MLTMHYRKGKNHLIFDFMAFNNELSYSKLLECLYFLILMKMLYVH